MQYVGDRHLDHRLGEVLSELIDDNIAAGGLEIEELAAELVCVFFMNLRRSKVLLLFLLRLGRIFRSVLLLGAANGERVVGLIVPLPSDVVGFVGPV